ncbi:FKBP-type peptidyl-prolyl cis-trans isomerase [Pseudoteredinibacter isoporae]|uniref:Peptidyl-prolyl cis-trans isomerase n=1 Tax=Pseudoteredinibacter isoporae TaxID=570281 RepID=A0A7X0MXB7_9GAMM|nr:peptidylprolyl isomerase [Pseudoteredinibacter isoporae]MBB6523095.1 FKBP-type peptidyl-prolyl cis-trans isomerase SlyD [Pseudoteredinibacter isoporae]NHO88615.1 peptidylprolyl isomerase [Pseudoteredinibacter isoporae]NIB22694.1 peptidylprolyl isomerase [Pseudoteredinibacter isoporae]
MKISKDTVVSFHYRLWNSSEEPALELETSHGDQASLYLHGHGNILPALEDAMLGREAGDVFSVELPPEKAYGSRRENWTQRVPIKHLIGNKKPKLGQIVHISTDQGQKQATVIKVGLKNVDIDANHPLAGKNIQFDIEVLSVREATSSEIDHGHAHGPGGHQH